MTKILEQLDFLSQLMGAFIMGGKMKVGLRKPAVNNFKAYVWHFR